MLQFACSQCDRQMTFPVTMAGEEVICDCGAMFTAPGLPNKSHASSSPDSRSKRPVRQFGSTEEGRAVHPQELGGKFSSLTKADWLTLPDRPTLSMVMFGAVVAIAGFLIGPRFNFSLFFDDANIAGQLLAIPLGVVLRMMFLVAWIWLAAGIGINYLRQPRAGYWLRRACLIWMLFVVIGGSLEIAGHFTEEDDPYDALRIDGVTLDDGTYVKFIEPEDPIWPASRTALRLFIFQIVPMAVLIVWSWILDKQRGDDENELPEPVS